jgi:hypothetical protein
VVGARCGAGLNRELNTGGENTQAIPAPRGAHVTPALHLPSSIRTAAEYLSTTVIPSPVRLRFEAEFFEFFEPNPNQTNQLRGILIQNPRPLIRRFRGASLLTPYGTQEWEN